MSDLTPWQELEEQAYHAYREWPLFLRLRLRALRQHLPATEFESLRPAESDVPPPIEEHDLQLLQEYGLMPEKAVSE